VINGNRFYEPRGRMRAQGFTPRALNPDDEAARRIAWGLLERWRKAPAGLGAVDEVPSTR
jgi:hypothetical protein